METLKTIALTLGYLASIAAFLGSGLKFLEGYRKMIDGQKCQLRAAMLHTYYRNLEQKEIRQYEMENFLQMYQAYKAMHGNSFIDEIHEEVTSWKIVT